MTNIIGKRQHWDLPAFVAPLQTRSWLLVMSHEEGMSAMSCRNDPVVWRMDHLKSDLAGMFAFCCVGQMPRDIHDRAPLELRTPGVGFMS